MIVLVEVLCEVEVKAGDKHSVKGKDPENYLGLSSLVKAPILFTRLHLYSLIYFLKVFTI